MDVSKILVVDNNHFYTRLMGDHLRDKGFDVKEACSGEQALREVEEDRPDLIILDLIMPAIDGMQVCSYLQSHEKLSSIAIVIVSGILLEEIGNLRRLGARAFVAKMQAEKILKGVDESIEWIQRDEPELYLSGFRDMHRREVVKELLEELSDRNSILESLSEGAVEINANDFVVYCNEAFAKALGRHTWELLNRSITECFPESEEQISRLVLELRADANAKHSLEVREGDRILEIRASSLRHPDQGGGLVFLVEDRTDRCEAEKEHQRLQMQLVQNEKLSSLGRLVAGVAHELNNPLTGVIGYSQLLLGRSPETKLKRQLERIYSQACRCQKIIQNLIIFGRQHKPVKRYLGLNGILTKVLNVMSFQLNLDDIKVVTELDPKLPLTMVDYDQLRQVFMNIINNAHHAMLESSDKTLTVRTSGRDGRILVTFEDTGGGIPADIIDKVMEPFFTRREVGKGMGLGLSISYSVVSDHAGELRIENGRDGGVIVTIDLPMVAAESSASGETESGSRRKMPRILVVDDEPVILDLMVDLLTESSFRADTAGNGLEALGKLRNGKYDALLLDLKMPHMSGRALYDTVCRDFPYLAERVVFSTGDTVDEETRQFLETTKQPVLSKPFEIEKLLDTLSAVLQPDVKPVLEPEPVS